MIVSCPKCKKRYRVRAESVGKPARCKGPSCGIVFRVEPPRAETAPKALPKPRYDAAVPIARSSGGCHRRTHQSKPLRRGEICWFLDDLKTWGAPRRCIFSGKTDDLCDIKWSFSCLKPRAMLWLVLSAFLCSPLFGPLILWFTHRNSITLSVAALPAALRRAKRLQRLRWLAGPGFVVGIAFIVGGLAGATSWPKPDLARTMFYLVFGIIIAAASSWPLYLCSETVPQATEITKESIIIRLPKELRGNTALFKEK